MSEENKSILEFKGFLSFLILHELKQKPLCGEDLAIKIGKRRGSQLTPGTIYPTLKVLRKKKLMKFKRFGRKKIYTLTQDGLDELEKQYDLFAKYFWGLKSVISKKRIKN